MTAPRLALGALVLGLAFSPTALAQPPDGRPFNTTRLALSLLHSLDAGAPDHAWGAGNGPELSIEVPFYWGRAQGGYHRSLHHGSRSVPDFETAFLFVGWGAEAAPMHRMRLLAALRTGVFWMDFEDEGTPAGGVEESELGFELHARARLQLIEAVDVSASVRWRPVLTQPNLQQTYVAVGLGYTFRNPDWLRRFFD